MSRPWRKTRSTATGSWKIKPTASRGREHERSSSGSRGPHVLSCGLGADREDYRFDTDEGSASLPDLFRGRSQLLIYHFMFGPEYTAGCSACSAIVDCYSGFVSRITTWP
jgi:hypothetical protein